MIQPHHPLIGESYMTVSRYIFASLFLLLVPVGEIAAQSNVDIRVEKLEETVRTLERRLANLEGQLSQRSAPAPSVPADKVNWRKLQRGMSEGDVEKLLGSPTRVHAMGSLTSWSYETPSGFGRVQFESRNGTLSSWSEP
jgi:hypothetical protein